MNLKFKATTTALLALSLIITGVNAVSQFKNTPPNQFDQLFFKDLNKQGQGIDLDGLSRLEIEWYYNQYFSTTQDNANLEAFYTGFSPQTFFDFSDECKDDMVLLLDRAYDFHLNMTAKTSFRDTWLISTNIVGNQFNEALYYCYQFTADVRNEFTERRERFVNFGDIYLSFIFNLLSNSLQIREAITTIQTSNDEEEKLEKWGQLFRIFLDFESYQNAGGLFSIGEYIQESAKVAKLTPKQQLQRKIEVRQNRGTRVRQDEEIEDPAEAYDWTFSSFVVSLPFGLLIGALGALPDESFAYKCSKNATSSRGDLLEMFEYFDLQDRPNGMLELNEAMSYWDDMGLYCWYAFSDDLSAEHFDDLSSGDELLQNILYNIGYMFNDWVSYRFYTPATVPNGDWAFFVAYLFGDFVMRFFYRDETV